MRKISCYLWGMEEQVRTFFSKLNNLKTYKFCKMEKKKIKLSKLGNEQISFSKTTPAVNLCTVR